MLTPSQLDFIKKLIAQGVDRQKIEDSLVEHYHLSPTEVAEVFDYINRSPLSSPPPINQKIDLPKPRPKSHRLLFLVVILILLIASITIAVYWFYYRPKTQVDLPASPVNSPNQVLEKMYGSLKSVNSLNLQGEIKLNWPGLSFSYQNISPDPNKKIVHEHQIFNILISGATNWQASAKTTQEYRVRLADSNSINLISFDWRNFGNDIYFKINDIVNLGLNLDWLKNRWLFYNSSSFNDANQPGQTAKTIACAQKLVSKITEILPILIDNRLVKVIVVQNDELVDGVNSYHYFYTIDRDLLIKAWPEVIKKINREQDQCFYQIDQTSQSNNDLSSFIADLERIGGEIWIGVDDNLPRRINFEILKTNHQTKETKSWLELDFNFSNFNENYNFVQPEQPLNLELALVKITNASNNNWQFGNCSDFNQECDPDCLPGSWCGGGVLIDHQLILEADSNCQDLSSEFCLKNKPLKYLWQKNKVEIPEFVDLENGDKKLNNFPAWQYCKNLNVGKFSDWRLPSLSDWQKIFDASSTVEVIKLHPGYYWTSNLAENNQAISFNLNNGADGLYDRFKENNVRCIRLPSIPDLWIGLDRLSEKLFVK